MENNISLRVKSVINWLISQGKATSQEDLGRKLGFKNKSYISQIVNGKINNVSFINKLSNFDKSINIDWILTGEGEMLKNENIEETKSILTEQELQEVKKELNNLREVRKELDSLKEIQKELKDFIKQQNFLIEKQQEMLSSIKCSKEDSYTSLSNDRIIKK